MEKAETEVVKPSKDRLFERYSQRDPEFNSDVENASDVLLDKIVAELESFDAELEGFRNNDKKIRELFNKEPKSARFLTSWATGGGDPITYLLDIFGPDIMDALQSEEGKAKIAESHAKWIERKTAEEQGEEGRMTNYAQSISDLVAFAEENKLSDEQAVKIFEKANQIAEEAMEGKYTRETFEMIHKAVNHDGNVQKAREEGERDGRNAKIEERLGKVQKRTEMPPSLGGQGAAMPEPKPKASDPVRDAIMKDINSGYKKKSTFGN